ncbi:hypothetical protein TRFO_43193 [Tritrichomonas foetus]|uniref:Auto-transporter adhesin head GIN domain-containing protein n=1 Tax=Tritrichomonas foetus TaxID=1144522 RepID=A0A1J4KRS3_9EUKA|nr:hypothetical protein TRFO_43193 [Tritrichomonas foetus]|eukprot:OHT13993.1 hypothetical protein TRFO_43193 [Tritrichomonas foetus]
MLFLFVQVILCEYTVTADFPEEYFVVIESWSGGSGSTRTLEGNSSVKTETITYEKAVVTLSLKSKQGCIGVVVFDGDVPSSGDLLLNPEFLSSKGLIQCITGGEEKIDEPTQKLMNDLDKLTKKTPIEIMSNGTKFAANISGEFITFTDPNIGGFDITLTATELSLARIEIKSGNIKLKGPINAGIYITGTSSDSEVKMELDGNALPYVEIYGSGASLTVDESPKSKLITAYSGTGLCSGTYSGDIHYVRYDDIGYFLGYENVRYRMFGNPKLHIIELNNFIIYLSIGIVCAVVVIVIVVVTVCCIIKKKRAHKSHSEI